MRLTRKKLLAVTAGVMTLGVAGTAFAFWTTTGAGSGEAAAANANGVLTLHASFADGALYPGGSVQVDYTADNGSDTDLQVGTIHADVSTNDPACVASDFSIDDVVSDTVVANNSTDVNVGQGTLSFANSVENQNACKGATITLTLTS